MANIRESQSRDSERLRHLPKNVVDVYVWYSLVALKGVAKAEVKARALQQQLSSDQLELAAHRLSTVIGGEDAG